MSSLVNLRLYAALLMGMWLSGLPAHGQEAPLAAPLDFTFGMVGLAPGQTARLNVVNIGPPSGPIPCGLVLAFLDDSGQTLISKFVQIESGKAVFLDLPAKDDGGRVQVRGIGYNPLLIPVSVSCQMLPTLEVFNNDTGATSLILAVPKRLTVPLVGGPGAL